MQSPSSPLPAQDRLQAQPCLVDCSGKAYFSPVGGTWGRDFSLLPGGPIRRLSPRRGGQKEGHPTRGGKKGQNLQRRTDVSVSEEIPPLLPVPPRGQTDRSPLFYTGGSDRSRDSHASPVPRIHHLIGGQQSLRKRTHTTLLKRIALPPRSFTSSSHSHPIPSVQTTGTPTTSGLLCRYMCVVVLHRFLPREERE